MGRGVLWAHTKVDSWIANTNHIQFLNHCVLGGITILFEDYNYGNDKDHITIA
jgi:hypothetical protein